MPVSIFIGAMDVDRLLIYVIRASELGRIVGLLFIATALRTFGTIVSYGCRVPCGIFVPSMAIGATFGRMIGLLVKAWQE